MMPKKNHTPIAKAIRQVVREFKAHPYDINDGRCDEFATRVCELVAEVESVDLGIDYGHVVVFYQKRWYDAEEPEGVSHWKHLPLVTRHLREQKRVKYSRVASPWIKEGADEHIG